MVIYFNHDDDGKIIEFSLQENNYFRKSVNLNNDEIDNFINNYQHYYYENNNLILKYDLDLIKNMAKIKTDELFSSYIAHIIPNTNEESYINTVFRDELREYIKDNELPTPVFDIYAKGLGYEDLHNARINEYQNILHTDIALADLISQKHKIEKFIDDCKDAEMLIDFEPNFHFISYSNMRWR